MAEASVSLELVRRIQAGEREAWDALYLRYRDRLLFSIRCRLGPGLRRRLQTEDILHSVIRDAIEDLPRFEARRDHALAHYLHACVLNKIRSKAEHWAAARRSGDCTLSPAVLERVNADNATPGYVDSTRYERLERALALLPENLREVILLRRIEGLTAAETATVLGKTEAAAAKLYARAMARLGTLARG
jgi:RNA polymerase sigma-70 factor (ECF subfamily)